MADSINSFKSRLESSGYCMFLYIITEFSRLLPEVLEIRFHYDRSYGYVISKVISNSRKRGF